MKYPNRYAHPFRADRNIRACSKCKNSEIISFSFHLLANGCLVNKLRPK